MKKGFSILMMLMAVILVVSSCGKSQRTYTEFLKDERKAIRKLMDSLDIKVIKEYPKDSVFAENEFLELPSGLYINVIDSGNGERAVLNKTRIFCRFEFDYISSITGTYTTTDGFDNLFEPLTFIYGANTPEDRNDFFASLFSPIFNEPLEYVGNKSLVKLIVPFKIGGAQQQPNGDPVYYKKLRYVFE